jgi:hypothetical protein
MVICDTDYRLQAFLQGEDFMMQALLLDMLLALGTMALLISLVVYQIYQIRWLPSHGRQIIAMVTSIRHETGKTKLGFSRNNSYLMATWTHPRTGRTYTFWTWIMNSSPVYAKGDLVPVWIDPNDPNCCAFWL